MAVENLAQFNLEMRKLGKTIPEEELLTVQKKMTFDGLSRIINRTPVDTGRARGNWQVTINEKPRGELDIEDKSGAAAMAAGIATGATIPPFAIVYIANNVSYIEVLERGRHLAEIPEHERGPFDRVTKRGVEHVRKHRVSAHRAMRGSERAPAGMVGLTFEELLQIFK